MVVRQLLQMEAIRFSLPLRQQVAAVEQTERQEQERQVALVVAVGPHIINLLRVVLALQIKVMQVEILLPIMLIMFLVAAAVLVLLAVQTQAQHLALVALVFPHQLQARQ